MRPLRTLLLNLQRNPRRQLFELSPEHKHLNLVTPQCLYFSIGGSPTLCQNARLNWLTYRNQFNQSLIPDDFNYARTPFTYYGGEWTFINTEGGVSGNNIFYVCNGIKIVGGYHRFSANTTAIWTLKDPLGMKLHYMIRISIMLVKLDQ